MQKSTVISLLSGGLDSATATAIALEAGEKVIALSFNYGQRHIRELKAAKDLARKMNIQEHHVMKVDLSMWGGSSLTDANQKIPSHKSKSEEIPNTYVPGRNTVFIAIALSLAEAKKANQIVLGVNAMDYSGYPDCRPDYLNAYQALANLSSKAGREGNGIRLWAPLITWKKENIIQEALRLQVPLELTWSCYKGGEMPCGICDSCQIRNTGLIQAGRADLCSKH